MSHIKLLRWIIMSYAMVPALLSAGSGALFVFIIIGKGFSPFFLAPGRLSETGLFVDACLGLMITFDLLRNYFLISSLTFCLYTLLSIIIFIFI
jgi:hypothetical protein